ncbi:hypothetical protein BN133_1049 [Cronobacter dublinensis 582]|nr:hypothetical protein BN133_1049 [Cronobacter dublinensis 582]
MGVVGVLFHGGGQLLHAGGGLLQRGGLLLGARREIGVACGDFAGALVNGLRAFTHGADGGDQRALHHLQMLAKTADFTAPGRLFRQGEIAAGDGFNARRGMLQRDNHHAAQHHEGQKRHDQRHRERGDHHHQTEMGAAAGVAAQLFHAIGAACQRFCEHFVVVIVKLAGRFVFMLDNRFEHAVFGIFQHRRKACYISVVTGFQLAVERRFRLRV